YLAAVERGLTPDTVREDAPINIKGWNPENYSRNYSGPVTLRDALAHSLNTVAVRLGVEVGPKAVVQTAQRLGITSPLQANASIALGTSEVTPLELVGAYATFANGGMGVIPYVIAGVKTVDGRTVYKRAPSGLGRVIDPQADGMMNAMMHEVFVSGTAKKGDIPGWDLAGKTGTSQDFRDAWVVGFSATLVTGVWLGNDDGEPTKRVSGGNLPVEIWNRVMVAGLRGDKPAPLPGAARWRRTSNAVAAANPAEPPTIGGMIDDLLGGGGQPAPARPQPAPQRGGPSREDKNFLERLFGVGE
ncbi:penicillin-binding transpeptidase domain-containing protein, partial [uncultured Methylobacterium sp.]|uniref:transglycosylase domain-containing protein n=1 Tax=uncultured Methylobacterium sp. TaxID=157278 RepID=UPI0025894E06